MPPDPTVLDAVTRILRDPGGCLTCGEILAAMNRACLHPVPSLRRSNGAPTWDTLEHRERLKEIEHALASHPQTFRNHGLGVGHTLRDDHAGPRRHRPPAKEEKRKENTMPPKMCEYCNERPIPSAPTKDWERWAARLLLCTTCYKDKAARQAQKEKMNVPRQDEAGTCTHCGVSAVSHGKSHTAKAARQLGLCLNCYCDADVRHARREKVGFPDNPNRRVVSARKDSTSPKPPVAGLLPAPPKRAAKKSARRLPARRRRPAPPLPAQADDPDLTAGIAACLRTSFAKFAAGQLRAIAADLEASAKEAAP